MGYTASLEYALTEDTQLFFMHIPKTAGQSLIQIIEKQFDEQEIARWLYPFCLPEKSPSFFTKHRYFHGHVEYDLMCPFLSRRPLAITMLREPIERYLSQFGNEHRVPLAQIPDTSPEVLNVFHQISLDEFIFDPPEILTPRARNYQNKQVKMLAFEFVGDPNDRTSETGPFGRNRTYILPTPVFEQAKERLDQFSFFGLTERFQDSLFLMAYTFGWPPVVEYKTLGVAPSGQRPYQRDLPPDVLKKIHDLNLIDQRLYKYAQQLFQARYDQMCHQLLDRYGKREHALHKLPLPIEVTAELLDHHYRRRFAERSPASSVLKLGFDQKISGLNWQMLEHDPVHGPFRWSGPGRCSTLDLPLVDRSSLWLRFSVAMAITEAVLDSLVVKVNEEPIELAKSQGKNGTTICEGFMPRRILARRPGCVRLSFEVATTVKALEVIPDSEDDRLLGIALNWLEVKPALT